MGFIDVNGVSLSLPDGRPLLADLSFRVTDAATTALIERDDTDTQMRYASALAEYAEAAATSRGSCGTTAPRRRSAFPSSA